MAFEGLPHGLLVLDRDGNVQVANRAATELLGIASGSEPRCCDLLGCRADEGPLAGVCLTGILPPAGEGHLELRLDLDTGSAWVTAAALENEQIVLQVRRNGSARFVHSEKAAGPELYISALGPLEVEVGGETMDGAWLEQRPGQLLRYLVCERHRPASADRITAALWPQADSRAVGRVRYFVHKLRDALEPERGRGESSFVVGSKRGYALHRSRVRLDVDDFEQRIAAGMSAFARGDSAAAAKLLSRGLALYRGELLADDPYAVWALSERDRLRDMAARSLRMLFQQLLQAGDLQGADGHLKRLIEFEPYDVNLQRHYVELSLRLGRRGEAQRRYSELRQRMLHDFDEELDFGFNELLAEGERQLRLA
ncbi:MAG TPA: BTAD domain-containing putative transcriptional regulator [Thermoleophilaceae bacterium]|jgi:DNA-binding SARP family transcriptional activator